MIYYQLNYFMNRVLTFSPRHNHWPWQPFKFLFIWSITCKLLEISISNMEYIFTITIYVITNKTYNCTTNIFKFCPFLSTGAQWQWNIGIMVFVCPSAFVCIWISCLAHYFNTPERNIMKLVKCLTHQEDMQNLVCRLQVNVTNDV